MDPTPENADDADDVPPWEQPGAVRRDCEPHRAEMLGYMATASAFCAVLSIVTLGIAGIAASVLGVTVCMLAGRDLASMAAGKRDPAGMPATLRARRRAIRAMVFCVGTWSALDAFFLPSIIGDPTPREMQAFAVPLVLGLLLMMFAFSGFPYQEPPAER